MSPYSGLAQKNLKGRVLMSVGGLISTGMLESWLRWV
jgi:hypothetical protein